MVRLQNHDSATLENLRAFFSSARGSLPVYIVFEQNGQKRTIQTNFKIGPEEQILKSIESIVGQGAVKIVE